MSTRRRGGAKTRERLLAEKVVRAERALDGLAEKLHEEEMRGAALEGALRAERERLWRLASDALRLSEEAEREKKARSHAVACLRKQILDDETARQEERTRWVGAVGQLFGYLDLVRATVEGLDDSDAKTTLLAVVRTARSVKLPAVSTPNPWEDALAHIGCIATGLYAYYAFGDPRKENPAR